MQVILISFYCTTEYFSNITLFYIILYLNGLFHYAASLGYEEIAKLLLQQGAPASGLNGCGHSPLYLAVESNITEVVAYKKKEMTIAIALAHILCDNGADPEECGGGTLSALELARRHHTSGAMSDHDGNGMYNELAKLTKMVKLKSLRANFVHGSFADRVKRARVKMANR